MTEFSKVFTGCVGSISQLSNEEINTLIGFLRKEQDKREDQIRIEKIKNAINAINDLTFFYDYFEIGGNEVYLSDVLEGLENLC
jgi:hypothetical protein